MRYVLYVFIGIFAGMCLAITGEMTYDPHRPAALIEPAPEPERAPEWVKPGPLLFPEAL